MLLCSVVPEKNTIYLPSLFLSWNLKTHIRSFSQYGLEDDSGYPQDGRADKNP